MDIPEGTKQTYYQKNKEAILAKSKAYRTTRDQNAYLQYQKLYYEEHKADRLEYFRKLRQTDDHKVQMSDYNHKYYQENKEYHKQYFKQYYKLNKHTYNKKCYIEPTVKFELVIVSLD